MVGIADVVTFDSPLYGECKLGRVHGASCACPHHTIDNEVFEMVAIHGEAATIEFLKRLPAASSDARELCGCAINFSQELFGISPSALTDFLAEPLDA